jgi:hypothetical protein
MNQIFVHWKFAWVKFFSHWKFVCSKILWFRNLFISKFVWNKTSIKQNLVNQKTVRLKISQDKFFNPKLYIQISKKLLLIVILTHRNNLHIKLQQTNNIIFLLFSLDVHLLIISDFVQTYKQTITGTLLFNLLQLNGTRFTQILNWSGSKFVHFAWKMLKSDQKTGINYSLDYKLLESTGDRHRDVQDYA